jgi:tRNA-dihydrouridine synthase B
MPDISYILPKQALLLAPMEDVTDLSFRIICRELGADLVFTEFVNADGLIRKCKKAKQKMKLIDAERPVGIQIYGSDVEALTLSARMAEENDPDIIDINAGCWVKKVVGRGAGAGLCKTPELLEEITRSVVNAVEKPVSVKTRLGWDMESINILDAARRIEDAGAVFLTIHCRTRSQGMSGEADWTWIDRIKEKVSFPVVLNGDVMCADDGRRAFADTKADGIMLARGAIGQPWLFNQIKNFLSTGIMPEPPTIKERVAICLRHLRAHIELKGEARGVKSFRKFYTGYLKGLRDSAKVRRALMFLNEYAPVEDELNGFALRYRDD